MERFHIVEHPADIGFEAFGTNREELFANSAAALMFLMFDPETVRPQQRRHIRVQGHDAPSLLVNWLSEILFLVDAEGWLLSSCEVEKLTEGLLEGMVQGETYDPARHQAKLQVKAVTYHQLALEKIPGGWRAQVYVDI